MPTPPDPPRNLVAIELRTISWTLILSGAISFLIGVLALVAPLPTIAALVLLFGAYAIVDGLVSLVAAIRAFRGRARAWPQAVRGVAGIFVGLFTFAFPPVTGVVLLVIAAVWAVVIGVLELLTAAGLRGMHRHAWLLALYGVILIAFGAFLVFSPAGLFAAAALIGMFAIARGVVAAWVGFSIGHATTTV
jgi:uncharacterized membrane protein HdeD (DUF308 family)